LRSDPGEKKGKSELDEFFRETRWDKGKFCDCALVQSPARNAVIKVAACSISVLPMK